MGEPAPSVVPGSRRRRNRPATMPPPAAADEGCHDGDRASVITPRTRDRKKFRWLQQRRKSRDKYGRQTNVLRRIDHDDGEASLLPPVEALSKRTLPLHEAAYLSDTSQEEPPDDDSSLGSESFLIGDKEHPIFLDGCVFDAGGMILDAIKELTEGPPEHSRNVDKIGGRRRRRRDQDRKSRWSSTTSITDRDVERAAPSLDDQTFQAILEIASEDGSPKDPDLQRAIDLNRLLDETYRQSRDNFRRKLQERRLQSSAGRDQPVTPTALRSPNEILEVGSPTPRHDPLTPTFLRSPASDSSSEADGATRPDDHILTPTSLGSESGCSPGPREDAKDRTCESRPAHKAPARLSIRIPSDDESFDYESCGKSLASATTVPRSHPSEKHHPATGSALSESPLRSPDDSKALLLNQILSEETENTGISDKHSGAGSKERSSLKRELHSVDGPNANAKDLAKSVGAPSPSELLEARTYLSDLSRLSDSPSPKMLKDARRFFDQILQSDSPRAPQNAGLSPANTEKQNHTTAATKTKLVGPSPESNWNRCKQKPHLHHLGVQDSSASYERQSSAKAISAPAPEGLTSHDGQQPSSQEIRLEDLFAPTNCLSCENAITASDLDGQFALGGEQSFRHLRRGHSLVYSTSASEGEQEMALKIRLLEMMRSEASMRRFSSHEKRRRRSHSPVTRRRMEQPGPLSQAASFESLPGNRLISLASVRPKQISLNPNPFGKDYGESAVTGITSSINTSKQPFRCPGLSTFHSQELLEKSQRLAEAPQSAKSFLLDPTFQYDESGREDFVEIMSVDSSLDWQKLAPASQNDTEGVQPGMFPGLLRRNYNFQNDEIRDGATDDVIEIISSADSSTCERTQQNRGKKFPPFSILPEIPETYSSEGEAGMDAKLFLRKKCANKAQSEAFAVPAKATNPSISPFAPRFHGTSRHRKSSRSNCESSIPVLEIVSSSDGGALSQSLLIPRLGGPENLSMKNGSHSHSISDVSSQQTFDQSTSLRDNTPNASFQRAPLPSSTTVIAIPPARFDKERSHSKKNKNCPASYIRPPVNCGKEDAPGLRFLEIVRADQIKHMKYQEGFHFSKVQRRERGSERAIADSIWPRTKEDSSPVSIGISPIIQNPPTDHKVTADIPIVSGRDIVCSRRQEESTIIVLDSSFDIAGPFELPTKDVHGDIHKSAMNHEVLQSDDSLGQDNRETNVSSIFRGLSTFLFSEAAKKKNQSFGSIGAGTKECPFSILERDCHAGVRFSNEGNLVEMTQIEKLAQDHARNSGLVLLQPNINIYAANPTADPLDKIEKAALPALSAPDSVDLKSSATKSMPQQITNVHKAAPGSKQSAIERMDHVESAQRSADSSSDEHTVIYIDDISSYSESMGRDEQIRLRPTERTAKMQQELKIVSTSVKNLEHKIAQVDKILSQAIESVTESVTLKEPALSLSSQSLDSIDEEEDDGLQKEVKNLAESEESLRRELGLLRCLPNDDGTDQHSFIRISDSSLKGATGIGSLLPSRGSESERRAGRSRDLQKSLPQDSTAELQKIDESPLPCLNAKPPPVAGHLLSASKVRSSTRSVRSTSKGSRMNFAVLHSRLQENIEVVYLDESRLSMDEESEEIEAVFVEENFRTNDFFKYGESKGMVFDCIRPNANGDDVRQEERVTRSWQMKPPTSTPLQELKSSSIPRALIRVPKSSSDSQETSQVAMQCRELPPSYTKANTNSLSQKSLQFMGKEVISLLDIDESTLEQPIFRERGNKGLLHITPRVSSLTTFTGSRAGMDPDDSLTDCRPRRHGADPPATGITIVSNNSETLPNAVKDTVSHGDSDLTNLKRRVEAVLRRSTDTVLTLTGSHSPDDQSTQRAASDAASGCADLPSKRDSNMSHSKPKYCADNQREVQLKEFIARGKSLIESSKGGARSNRIGEGDSKNKGTTRSIFSFDHVLDEADRILSNIGVTNGSTTGASQSTLSDDDDSNMLSHAEMKCRAAGRLYVETAPSFPDLLSPLTLEPASVHQSVEAAKASVVRSESKVIAMPSSSHREDPKVHRRATRKVNANRKKSGVVELAKSSASPRARNKVYQWKLGKSLTRAFRKKTAREGASRAAEAPARREAACPRTVAESDDSQAGEKLPSKLFFVPL